jgi:hypothetical protein
MNNRIVRLVPLAILVSLLFYIIPYSRRPFNHAAVTFAAAERMDATSTASDDSERVIEESLRGIANTTLGVSAHSYVSFPTRVLSVISSRKSLRSACGTAWTSAMP